MNDDDFLNLRGFNFQKLLVDNYAEYADKAAKLYVMNMPLINPEVKKAYADGFRECTRIMTNSFEDCSPQKEINLRIDELIAKLERIKK